MGQGEDLVFLHGYGGNKDSFLPQIRYFSQFFRVTALSFPGMGKNPPLPYAFALDDYCRYVREILSRQNVHSPVVVGHSFGGRVAVKLAATGGVKKLVVVSGAGIVRHTAKYHFDVALYRLSRRISPERAEKRFGSDEYKQLTPVQKESYKLVVNEDLRATARQITVPTLLLYGAKDEVTPPSFGRAFHREIANSKLQILKGCGHFLYLEDPLTFQLSVEKFLE